jgi:hypothetical protein
MSDLSTTPMPRTLMEWVVLGLSIGGGAVAGAVSTAFGLSKRLGALETALAAAAKDCADASADAVAAKDAAAAMVTSALATMRGELAGVAAQAHAAALTAQAAASGASNPAALRLAIADELARNNQIATLAGEVERLRAAAQRGDENTLRMTGALERILGKLEGM